MASKKPDNNCMGEWNAYVAAGETREIRQHRLSETPENIRSDVKRHVITVFRMKNAKRY